MIEKDEEALENWDNHNYKRYYLKIHLISLLKVLAYLKNLKLYLKLVI